MNYSMLIPGMLTEAISPQVKGTVEIVHDAPDMLTRLRAARDGQPLRADKYTRLLIDGSVWMTDAEYECATNREIIRRAHGDVLIAGLGLGLILPPIICKRSVTSVTVVEMNADVIAVVGPYYLTSAKVIIAKGDIFKWRTRRNFDVIYFDIFQNVPNSGDRPTIDHLKRRYREHLKPGGWMSAWCEANAR